MIPFTIASMISSNKFNKVKDLYNENFKALKII